MFGAYVTAYGHVSPGGGFAGGSILAAALILERYVGIERKHMLTKPMCLKGVSYSLMGYGVLKGIAFLEGAMHIHLIDWPLGQPGALFSGGVIPMLNILIGLIVMMAFVLMFDLFNEDLFREDK
jgi:multicomponent Na+:H+ antiporter subunit B